MGWHAELRRLAGYRVGVNDTVGDDTLDWSATPYEVASLPTVEPARKPALRRLLTTGVALALVAAAIPVALRGPRIDVSMETLSVGVLGAGSVSVWPHQVQSVELLDTLPELRRTFGIGGFGVLYGRVASPTLGRGFAFVRTTRPPVIQVIFEPDAELGGNCLFVNCPDPALTFQFYEFLNNGDWQQYATFNPCQS